MKPFRAVVLAGSALLAAPLLSRPGRRAARARSPDLRPGQAGPASLAHRKAQRLCRLHQPALGALSRSSRARYFSWVSKNGPTGRERIIYGLYTIYDTADCRKNVENANGLEPRDAALEAAAWPMSRP